MTLQEERLQILKMVEEGKISAAEAAQLLSALETGVQKENQQTSTEGFGRGAKWLRIRVSDGRSGRQKVSVNLPMGLVSVAMKVGARFAPEMQGISIEEISEMIRSGAQGRIVDVEDVEGGERVEIFVE
jgi:hypothetical protein